MVPEEIFFSFSWVSGWLIFVFSPSPFVSNLSYFYLCESNLDPDPQYWLEYIGFICQYTTGVPLKPAADMRLRGKLSYQPSISAVMRDIHRSLIPTMLSSMRVMLLITDISAGMTDLCMSLIPAQISMCNKCFFVRIEKCEKWINARNEKFCDTRNPIYGD